MQPKAVAILAMVVNPWLKIFGRFSREIPTPLSLTEMFIRRSAARMRTVIHLFFAPALLPACLTLQTTLTRICSTLCLSPLKPG